jgi:hypothetical protein
MEATKFYEQKVDRLFRQLRNPRGTVCDWPVFGGSFVKGEDDETEIRQTLCNAFRARDWFAENGPPDAPPLPLDPDDKNRMRFGGGIGGIVGYYARSLDIVQYVIEKHPSFYDFACGLMALKPAWADEELKRRFPPRPLEGLQRSYVWWPPKPERTRSH